MDLVCRNKFDGAFYHQLHDCILPHICSIAKLHRENGTACYDTWLSRWIKFLAPTSKRVLSCNFTQLKEKCNRDDTLKSLLPASRRKPSHIVLLQRSNTRMFDKVSFINLKRALQSLSPLIVYNVTESVPQTVEIFRNAHFVVGYHGAGLANVYFMKNFTRVLEISTFVDLNNSKHWRTNMQEVTRYGTYFRRVVRLPLQQLLQANNVTYRDRDPDHYIKNLRWVSLKHQDIRSILDFGRSSAK